MPTPSDCPSPARDHLFISYAVEQQAFTDWIARKLACIGYAVWYDRIKLLGGEDWPANIDRAIAARTFRMLAVLSRASLAKLNPTGERLKGFAVGKTLGIPDFVIPLRVEPLKPEEITWNLQPINYIDFSQSWAKGFAALVKKLESINAIRPLVSGGALAVSSFEPPGLVLPSAEVLCTNTLAIQAIPDVINRFWMEDATDASTQRGLRSAWAFRAASPTRVFSFEKPPAAISARSLGGTCWRDSNVIDGIRSRDVVVSLIHATLERHMAAKGLEFSPTLAGWYFPSGLLPNNWLPYSRPDGMQSRVLAVGERTFGSAKTGGTIYRYHLSPVLSVLRGTGPPSAVVLRLRVHLTAPDGIPFVGRALVARRKHICRNWWNDDWLGRVLGVCQFLRTAPGVIRLGGLSLGSEPRRLVCPAKLEETIAENVDPEEMIPRAEIDDDEEFSSGING